MPVIALALLGACRHRAPADGPRRAETVDPSSDPDTATTEPTTGQGPWLPLPPSVRVIGLPELRLGVGEVDAFPAFGSDPGFLIASHTFDATDPPDPDAPNTLTLPGVLPPGDYDVLDVWDGVSGWTGDIYPPQAHPAGDVDGDAHLDLWLFNGLYAGPFPGRRVVHAETDALALFDGEGSVVAAGFDADADGQDDVVLMRGYRRGTIYYGPFEGLVPGLVEGLADPSSVTTLGEDECLTSDEAWVLRDHLGPGHHAIALGRGGGCGDGDTFVFDLMHPRGTALTAADAFAVTEDVGIRLHPGHVDDAGDLDGDGHPDVVYGESGLWSRLVAGPLDGWFRPEDYPPLALEHPPLQWVNYAIGDLNGDGVQELAGMYVAGDVLTEDTPQWWVVLFSPYTDPIDLADGLPIAPKNDLDWGRTFGSVHADLDGDGLEDLVDTFVYEADMSPTPPPELVYAGEIRIWYGKDLLAAELARQAAFAD